MLNQTLLPLIALCACIACSPATVTVADDDEVRTTGSCAGRQCGVDPGTKQDCGSCETPGRTACNDGRCEATCDPKKCGAMNYKQNTCGERKQCQQTRPGAITTVTFTCTDGGKRCEQDVAGASCGTIATDCTPCDLTGKGDGRCFDDECMHAGDVTMACKKISEETPD